MFTVNSETREVIVPSYEEFLGAQYDDSTSIRTFSIPRYTNLNKDLFTSSIRIVFSNARGEVGFYPVPNNNITISGDDVLFDWVITKPVMEYDGRVSFAVCCQKLGTPYTETYVQEVDSKDADGEPITVTVTGTRTVTPVEWEWHSLIGHGRVGASIEDNSNYTDIQVETIDDALRNALAAIESAKENATGVTKRDIEAAVASYLSKNPVNGLDATGITQGKSPVSNGDGTWTWSTVNTTPGTGPNVDVSNKIEKPLNGSIGQVLVVQTIDANGRPDLFRTEDLSTITNALSKTEADRYYQPVGDYATRTELLNYQQTVETYLAQIKAMLESGVVPESTLAILDSAILDINTLG